jgi:uncharacterized protein YdiU (UPF0061 family)
VNEKADALSDKIANPISENSYRALPSEIWQEAAPDAAPAPEMVILNRPLLAEWGISAGWFDSDEALAILSGRRTNVANSSIAMAYSGHQFGGWSPVLGDGRAHMLGQMRDGEGRLVDVQLKGSGRTRFSRGGDGKATLASALREYLVSEAMAGLGIPATRSLAVIATGEEVRRDMPMLGGLLVRVARSHIRVGSFQFAAAHLGEDAVRALADHMITHHYPEAALAQSPAAALLRMVIDRQAALVAKWMQVGFIHGVMNTDNMSIVGETIDFGPCAFIDEFRPNKVFSSIDTQGRYAWNQQPNMAQWNLVKFAETLLPLFSANQDEAVALAQAEVDRFPDVFNALFWSGFATKLGLGESEVEQQELIQTLFKLMTAAEADFTLFFDRLTRHAAGEPEAPLLAMFKEADGFADWLSQWRALRAASALSIADMRAANPVLIARNHQVERALSEASDRNDFTRFHRLATALRTPFDVHPDLSDLLDAPMPDERVTATFCGT